MLRRCSAATCPEESTAEVLVSVVRVVCLCHAGLTIEIAHSAPGLNGARAHRHVATVVLKSGIETSSSRRSDPDWLVRARMS